MVHRPPMSVPPDGVRPQPAGGVRELPTEVDVLIAGGGPVGSALATALGHHGVAALAIERRAEIQTQTVRARNISVRTLETARRWGIAGRFREARTLPDAWHRGYVIVTRVGGHEIGSAYADRPTWTPNAHWHEIAAEPPQDLPQYQVNRLFRERALQLGARVLTGWEIEGVEQDADGVTAAVRDLADDRLHEIRARWVAACDGARSAVRRSVGIQMRATEPQGRMLNVNFRLPRAFEQLGVRPGVNFMVYNQDVSGICHPYDGDWWRVGIGPLPVDVEPEDVDLEAEIRKFFAVPVEIDSISYSAHLLQKRIAETYRRGRVLLAGDSAVAFPPHLGQNLNTGVADAVVLGWTLAAVVQGWGGDALLDAYAVERQEAAHRLADASLETSQDHLDVVRRLHESDALEDDTPEGDAQRDGLGRDIARLMGSYPDGLVFDQRHVASPIVVGDGTPSPPFDPVRVQPAAVAGHRAPHVWLREGDPLSDHFGRWFTLLDLGAEPVDVAVIAQAAAVADVPLTVLEVAHPGARAAYAATLVLVRPDHLVAWRGEAAPDDPDALLATVRGAVATAIAPPAPPTPVHA